MKTRRQPQKCSQLSIAPAMEQNPSLVQLQWVMLQLLIFRPMMLAWLHLNWLEQTSSSLNTSISSLTQMSLATAITLQQLLIASAQKVTVTSCPKPSWSLI